MCALRGLFGLGEISGIGKMRDKLDSFMLQRIYLLLNALERSVSFSTPTLRRTVDWHPEAKLWNDRGLFNCHILKM